jgi:hypothetical protein
VADGEVRTSPRMGPATLGAHYHQARSDARSSVFLSTETAAGLQGHNFSDRPFTEIGAQEDDVNVNVMVTFMPSSRAAL